MNDYYNMNLSASSNRFSFNMFTAYSAIDECHKWLKSLSYPIYTTPTKNKTKINKAFFFLAGYLVLTIG